MKNHRIIALAAGLAAGVSCLALAAGGAAMAAGSTPTATAGANPLAVGANSNPLHLPNARTAPLAAGAAGAATANGGNVAGAAAVAATAAGGNSAVVGTTTVAPSSEPIGSGNPGSGSATASGAAGGGTTPTAQDIASALAAIGAKNPAKMIRGVSGSTCAVNVVTIASSTPGTDMQRLDDAINRHEHKITKLRSALNGNSCISADLKAQDVAIGSVVAAQEDTGGEVTLFSVPS